MKPFKPKNTDQYIKSFPLEIQILLQSIRAIIKKSAPKATEEICYNMPAYRQNKVLVYFAACKNHIGFYPTSSPIIVFAKELVNYKTSKGAIQFPFDKPLPKTLITQIVQYRVQEDSQQNLMSKKQNQL